MDEWLLRVQCLLRSQGIRGGQLQPLFAELDLAPDQPGKPIAVDLPLLAKAERARTAMLGYLPRPSDQTSNAISTMFVEKATALAQLDKYSKIEVTFFNAHIGKASENRLQGVLEKLMPAKG
eukprot:7485219-Lingulodinium_polyedra.AAC.1